jgi:hypothetical protein
VEAGIPAAVLKFAYAREAERRAAVAEQGPAPPAPVAGQDGAS